MQIAVGTYVGNGSDNRAITDVGFQPDAVIIKAGGAASGRHPSMRIATMPAGYACGIYYTAWETDRIKSLDASGFTIGTDDSVNSNGVTYHWLALGDNGNSDLKVGLYTGNSTDNRSITGVGFQPDFVIVRKCDGTDSAWWRTSDVAGDKSASFGGSSDASNCVQALEADGFQVGASSTVNQTGVDYAYLAVKKSALTAGGTYTGDGTDDRNITGVGFQPDAVWVKRTVSGGDFVSRPSTESGDLTHFFLAYVAGANRIQSLLADGFQIGSDVDVNASGSTYRWWAWKAGTLGDLEIGVSDSIALTDTIGDREFGAADGLALSEQALAATPKAQDDGIALSELVEIAQGIVSADSIALSELVVLDQGKLNSHLELQASVSPRLNDRLQLVASVFNNRPYDRLELIATVSPKIVERVMLEASVVNQAQKAAGEAVVIAPVVEITFL